MGAGGPDVKPGTASQFSTLQNLIKPFIGAGILALPSAFEEGGVVASSVLMALLALGVIFCIRCLLVCVDWEWAREHNLDYDEKTGTMQRMDETGVAAEEGTARTRTASRNRSKRDGDVTPSSPLTDHSTIDSDELSLSQVGISDDGRVQSSSSAGSVNAGDESAHADASSSFSSSSSSSAPQAPFYSFRDIGERAFGRWGTFAVDFNLCASQIGFCIAYVSFISQNMHEVVPGVSRVAWIGILFACWIILVQVRDMRHLAFSSAFGNFVYIVSLSIIFYDGFAHHCCVSAEEMGFIRVGGLPLVFGTGCFSLEGIGLVLPVKRAMKEGNKFAGVLNIALAFVTTCYVVFGALGVLFYGKAVHSIITNNLQDGPLANAVRVSLSLSLFFSYAIQLFPVSELIDGLWDTRVFGMERPKKQQEKYLKLGEEMRHDHDPSTPYDNQTVAASPALVKDKDAEREDNTNGVSQSIRKNNGYASISKSAESSVPTVADLMNDQQVTYQSDPIPTPSHEVAAPFSSSATGAVHMPDHPPSRDAQSSGRKSLHLKREVAFICSRIVLVAFTALVSIIFPNFGLIVSLVGSFSNSAIAFILPQMFYLKLVLYRTERSTDATLAAQSQRWWTRNKRFILPYTIIVLGVCASIVGIYSTIRDMVTGEGEE